MVEISDKGNWKDKSQQHVAEIEALLKASHAVLKYRKFNDTARSVFDTCKELIGATAGYVALLSKDGAENEVLFLDSGGLPCTVDPSLPMPIRGLRGEAYHMGKAVYDNNFSESKWMKHMPEGHVGLENVLFAPLVIEGKTVGLLGLANKPVDFTERDAEMASALSKLVAIALLNSRTLESLEEAKQRFENINIELEALYKVSSAIEQTMDMDELFSILLKTVTSIELLNVERKGGIFITEGDNINLVAHLGHSEEFLNIHKGMKIGDCLCGLAAKTGEIVISKNSGHDSRHTIIYPDIVPHGHIIVPLKARGRVMGVSYLYLPADVDVDEHKISILLSIGNQIGIAIDNARLYQETKELSLHDPLTGLANRRLMNIMLEKTFAGAKRFGKPLSVIMLDIDHFKDYNDTFGHTAGDNLLVNIAKVLSKETRGVDLVVRYGGEEFLVLLHEAELEMARKVAERIRKAVETETKSTISLGVSSYHSRIQRKEELIDKADAALYLAKQRGRNRVEASED